jgi:hypothetical protein
MIRSILILTVTLGISQLAAHAQISITYTGGPGESNVVNSAGTPINGDIVSIGTFTNGFIPTSTSTIAELQGNWLNFDSTTTHNILGLDGRFGATSPGVNNPAFNNKQIYLWITEGSGNNITEYGLFTSTNPDWTFPLNNSALPPNPIDSNEVNTFIFGDGILGSGGSTPGSLQTLAVTVVPEPGSLSILALGGLLLAGARARRR